ncbi:MAG: DUF3108 domain-containing protein [Devosia sp.]|nr:DUF3108 domain-containing protein [Devosia sp.]
MRFWQALKAASCCFALWTAPVAAAEVKATAQYLISLSGTNIAAVTIRLNDSGRRYALALDAKITGLAQLVASGVAKVDSSGLSNGTGLVSERFDLLTRASGEDFTVAVEYAQREVTAFVVDPPLINNIDRVALERKHLRDVNDMVAAFVLKGGALNDALCSRKMQVFTGLERFNVAMRFARADVATSKRTGYQGPVILCNIRYTPVSGHFTTSEITRFLADSDRILIWYAPLAAPGYFIPYRVLLTTSVGDLSMVLTELEQ